MTEILSRHVFELIRNGDTTKEATITVRVPPDLKRRLAERARRERRSISAQVVFELERATAREAAGPSELSAVGLFKGARIPSDADFAEVRSKLWQRLEKENA